MANRIIVLPEQLTPIIDQLSEIKRLVKKTNVPVSDPILTTEEVMQILKISRRSLQTWRDEGVIAFSAINNKFYYRLSEINKMLDEHLIPSQKEGGARG